MKPTRILALPAALFITGCCCCCYQQLPAPPAKSIVGTAPLGALVANRSVSPLAVLAAAGQTPVAIRTRGVQGPTSVDGYTEITLWRLPEDATNVTRAYRDNVEDAQQRDTATDAAQQRIFQMLSSNSELNSTKPALVEGGAIMVTVVNNTGEKLHLWGQSAPQQDKQWSDLDNLGIYMPEYNRPAFRMRDKLWIQYYAVDDNRQEYLCEIFEAQPEAGADWKGYRLLVK